VSIILDLIDGNGVISFDRCFISQYPPYSQSQAESAPASIGHNFQFLVGFRCRNGSVCSSTTQWPDQQGI
jgi:hypothetical protein